MKCSTVETRFESYIHYTMEAPARFEKNNSSYEECSHKCMAPVHIDTQNHVSRLWRETFRKALIFSSIIPISTFFKVLTMRFYFIEIENSHFYRFSFKKIVFNGKKMAFSKKNFINKIVRFWWILLKISMNVIYICSNIHEIF